MASKTVCPITRSEFAANARPITVVILDHDGTELGRRKLYPRTFSTDSLGWNLSDKVEIPVLSQPVVVQVGLNATVVGSKDLPKDAPKPA